MIPVAPSGVRDTISNPVQGGHPVLIDGQVAYLACCGAEARDELDAQGVGHLNKVLVNSCWVTPTRLSKLQDVTLTPDKDLDGPSQDQGDIVDSVSQMDLSQECIDPECEFESSTPDGQPTSKNQNTSPVGQLNGEAPAASLQTPPISK